jgi:hypothetical protein
MVFSVTHYIKKIKCYFEKLGTFSQETTKSCKCNKVFQGNMGKNPKILFVISDNRICKKGISDNPYRAFVYNEDTAPEGSDIPLLRIPSAQRRKIRPFRKRDSDKRKASLRLQTNSEDHQEKIPFSQAENLPFRYTSFGVRSASIQNLFS